MSRAIAPIAPVTLTGISRLRRSVATFDNAWSNSQYFPYTPVSLAMPNSIRPADHLRPIGAMADARHTLLALRIIVVNRAGNRGQVRVLRIARERFDQHFGRPLR